MNKSKVAYFPQSNEKVICSLYLLVFFCAFLYKNTQVLYLALCFYVTLSKAFSRFYVVVRLMCNCYKSPMRRNSSLFIASLVNIYVIFNF